MKAGNLPAFLRVLLFFLSLGYNIGSPKKGRKETLAYMIFSPLRSRTFYSSLGKIFLRGGETGARFTGVSL